MNESMSATALTYDLRQCPKEDFARAIADARKRPTNRLLHHLFSNFCLRLIDAVLRCAGDINLNVTSPLFAPHTYL
jgi:hypothetical protein